MYNSSFSRSAFGLEIKDNAKSKGKSCGYYVRIIFFFSSLIQSLIIASLVLFLIYGQPKQSAEEKRAQDLEESFRYVSAQNYVLKQQAKTLNETLQKAITEKHQCERKCERCPVTKCPVLPPQISIPNPDIGLRNKNQQLEIMMKQVKNNFTQTVQDLKSKMDAIARVRDKLQVDKTNMEETLQLYSKICKEDFATPLKGIQDVTRTFLSRIENLFPHNTFYLTFDKQQAKIDQIRSTCTNFSKDMEDKFQHYLDSVGEKVSEIQEHRSKLMMENKHLVEQCSHKRSSDTERHSPVPQSHVSRAKRHLQKTETPEQGRTEREMQVLHSKLKSTDMINIPPDNV
ncbi:plasmalemma vesicle associated protein b [Paramormyrops kingsleyae]|uniref:Plasmalemma vesicle associated protein b n=1 Tax=Paramormyrops kingsleyae TaxID=1676925 RepID=A0A3B3S6B5_9TELE|nr:plasmalemma vesicle-associated protein-like [Paramormyrops kingsleyae]